MKDTSFNIVTDALSQESQKFAKHLLEHKDENLKALAAAGIHEDETDPYVYYVPTNLSFDVGNPTGYPLRSLWAIVIMARASYANAGWLDCDKEGYPELPQFCGGEVGFHRVKITDPFALCIDVAIKNHQEEMVRAGKARIVNGRFFKVA